VEDAALIAPQRHRMFADNELATEARDAIEMPSSYIGFFFRPRYALR
jgi:hypothetical protein